MRILVADQNTLLLAAIAGTFGRHCVIVTATRREACLEHLANERFDVVVACEKLRDYTGLELLSEVETLSPHALRIFSAPAAQLARLGSRLDHFGLLGTLSYPIEARKLLVALKVARTKLPARPKVRHVVLESEWDTGERLGLLEQELEVEPAAPPTLVAASPEQTIAAAPVASKPVERGRSNPLAPGRRSIPVAPMAIPVAPALAAPIAATTATAVPQGPDDIPIVTSLEETSVSHVRRVRELPAAEEASFEVSFDENPNRLEASAPQAPVAIPTHPGTQKGVGAQGRGRAAPSTHAAPNTRTTPSAPTASSPNRGSRSQPRLAHAPRPDETVDVSFNAQPGLATPANNPSVQAPPSPAPLPAQPVDPDIAANDPAFGTGDGEKAAAQSGSKSVATAKAQPAPAAQKTIPSGPQPRRPSVPTAAQREAFQRAVARRNAGRQGLFAQVSAHGNSNGNTNTGGRAYIQQASDASGNFRPHWHGTHSLSDLARIATSKRPLTQANSALLPKRKVFVVGSGIAAVLLASVLAFELTGSHPPTHHSRRAVAAQLFSPNASLVAQNNATESPPQVFGAAPARPTEVSTPGSTSNQPQPQVFDPNTAPEDPPPPPALERPGPMEPPSMGHNGPPLGMQDGGTE